MASVENFSRVLNVELHGVGREERFDLTILNVSPPLACQWHGPRGAASLPPT